MKTDETVAHHIHDGPDLAYPALLRRQAVPIQDSTTTSSVCCHASDMTFDAATRDPRRRHALDCLPVEVQLLIYNHLYSPWIFYIRNHHLLSSNATPKSTSHSGIQRLNPSCSLLRTCRAIYTLARPIFEASYTRTIDMTLLMPVKDPIYQYSALCDWDTTLRPSPDSGPICFLTKATTLHLRLNQVHDFQNADTEHDLPNIERVVIHDTFIVRHAEVITSKIGLDLSEMVEASPSHQQGLHGDTGPNLEIKGETMIRDCLREFIESVIRYRREESENDQWGETMWRRDYRDVQMELVVSFRVENDPNVSGDSYIIFEAKVDLILDEGDMDLPFVLTGVGDVSFRDAGNEDLSVPLWTNAEILDLIEVADSSP